ncbi:hypothetical protein V6N12_066226 [Hibiscus sabdariffa]
MENFTLQYILISVGRRPFIPAIPGNAYAIDSDAALDLPSKPEKIAIVGGGYIALEFVCIFNGLKSESVQRQTKFLVCTCGEGSAEIVQEFAVAVKAGWD